MMTLAPSPAAEYYADNYYTADQTVDTSAWFGRAAETLGLSGKVDQQVFADVLNGKRLIEALKESVAATLIWAEKNVIEARVWDPELGRQTPEKTGAVQVANCHTGQSHLAPAQTGRAEDSSNYRQYSTLLLYLAGCPQIASGRAG